MARHSAALLVLGLFCVRGGLGQEVLLGDNGPSSAALSFNPATDPLADVDTYKLLTQADIEGQWSQDDGRNVTEKMKELMSFGSITHVDVKLVGFDGDGNYDLKVDEADFLRYFETVLEEHEKEAMVVNAKKGKSHILPIRKRFFFRVIKAKASINEDITNRIRSWIVTKNSNDIDEAIRSGSRVPVNLVDEVIRKDYLSGDLSQTHTIYLLNPKRVVVKDSPAADADPGAGGGGGDPKEKRNPVFKEGDNGGFQDTAWMDNINENSDDESVVTYSYDPTERDATRDPNSNPPCGTTMWAGRERYMWIDLTAGPVLYGPHTSGEGLVSEFSIPRLDNFQVEGLGYEYEEDGETHHFAFVQEFLAEVVALVGKTCDLMIEPSLHHFPVPFVKTLRLHLVHITNDPNARTQFADRSGYIAGMPKVKLWDTIKQELGHRGAAIAMQGQTILYNRSVVQMDECKLCLAAYAASLRSYTSTVLRGQLKTQVHEYVDSKELHYQLLSLLNKQELGLAEQLGIYGWQPSQMMDEEAPFREEWTIPVLLFDLEDSSLLLLDRFHQAVSFPEMVLAVQSKAGAATVDFSCNDDMVTLDAADATRATFASLLQTGWGVSATHEHFSGKKNKMEVNYLWSVAPTPFGPFSSSARLTFALIDAARRNVVFSSLNASIAEVARIMAQFDKFGKQMEDVLLPGEHLHFVRRWNVLRFKIRRTSTYLSLLNFNTAQYYARSLRHDVRAIRNAVLRAGQFVHSYVGCVHDDEPSVLRFLIYVFAGGALLIMAYVAVHNLLHLRKRADFKKKL